MACSAVLCGNGGVQCFVEELNIVSALELPLSYSLMTN